MPTLTLQNLNRRAVMLIAIVFSAPTFAGGSAQSTVQRSVLLSVGQTQQALGDVAASLVNQGYSAVSVNDDQQANSWALGYRHPINAQWSLDVNYLDQGKTTPSVQATLPVGKSNAQAAQDAAEALAKRGKGISLTGVRHYAVGKGWTLQGGLGAYLWQSDREATVNGSTHNAKSNGVSPLLQLGVSYGLTPKVSVDLTWQDTFMPDEDVQRLAVGLAVGW